MLIGRVLLAVWVIGILAGPGLAAGGAEAAPEYVAGVARVDITPEEPIRLTGYAVRGKPSEGIEQRLNAKALAVGQKGGGPAVLVTIDLCGVPEETYFALRDRLKAKANLAPDRLTLSLSHTHTGPCVSNWAPNIFARDIPKDQQEVIDRYSVALVDRLESVVLAALKDLGPARLSWAQGSANFARNRRTAGGPVDSSLPVLKVEDWEGKLRALVANYACHCTTLGGEFNKTCGDWAGYAQAHLEQDHPGAMAFITVGCGADANPHPRGGADLGLALSQQHGQALAREVRRLLDRTFKPIRGKLETRLKTVGLPFAPHFTREQWEERARQEGIVGYHARKNLTRLEKGETLPGTLPYHVQTWTFGQDLALVFLNGEVVVDYALRLKQELDASRLWVTAYANYVPCYIPSRRILREGGYEAESSLWYYDRPQQFAPEIEDLVVQTVLELLSPGYRVKEGTR